MRKTIYTFIALCAAACVTAPVGFAHNVFPTGSTIDLSMYGPISADVTVQHFPGEGCVVSVSLSVTNQPARPLVLLSAVGPSTSLDVSFVVSALRGPDEGQDSQSVVLSGS